MAPALTRRETLTLLAVTAAGGALLPRSAFAQESLIEGADVCVIIPEVTEGPYYFDPALVRTDITEGRPGVPVRLKLQVVDHACVPMANARVDVWHCDASGQYSGYSGQTGGIDTIGETFMRGTQMTDAQGLVEFATVYPGWYRGRTTHIHFKVFLDETNVLTGQIFFPDDISETVYATAAPYNERTGRDTFNDTDRIARQAGSASVARIGTIEEGYEVALIVGVDPSAVSAGGFGGPGGPQDGAMSFPLTNG